MLSSFSSRKRNQKKSSSALETRLRSRRNGAATCSSFVANNSLSWRRTRAMLLAGPPWSRCCLCPSPGLRCWSLLTATPPPVEGEEQERGRRTADVGVVAAAIMIWGANAKRGGRIWRRLLLRPP